MIKLGQIPLDFEGPKDSAWNAVALDLLTAKFMTTIATSMAVDCGGGYSEAYWMDAMDDRCTWRFGERSPLAGQRKTASWYQVVNWLC